VRPARALGHGLGAHAAALLAGELTLAEAQRHATAEAGPRADDARDRAALLDADCAAFVLLGLDEAWSRALDAVDASVPRVQAGGREGWTSLLTALARLHVAGFALDWEGFERDLPRRRVHLPTYPFERKAYWFTSKRKKG
jgi:acyl transferase domain-containing protein